jgi:hypothetical protein
MKKTAKKEFKTRGSMFLKKQIKKPAKIVWASTRVGSVIKLKLEKTPYYISYVSTGTKLWSWCIQHKEAHMKNHRYEKETLGCSYTSLDEAKQMILNLLV